MGETENTHLSTAGRFLNTWWPALLVMAAIFALSSRPADSLPNLGLADTVAKKSGHVIGYGALAAAYWRGLGWNSRHGWLAFAMAAAYGASDELHQAFVPGRHASAWDVILFDATGAFLGLLLSGRGRPGWVKPGAPRGARS